MCTASSARRACRALASASENTATVRTPRRRAVLMTRHAISPRLPIRILVNMVLSLEPIRLPLFEECADAFLGLRRRSKVGDALRCFLDHDLIDGAVDEAPYELFGGRLSLRPSDQQTARDCVNPSIERIRCANFVHQANPLRFVRVE